MAQEEPFLPGFAILLLQMIMIYTLSELIPWELGSGNLMVRQYVLDLVVLLIPKQRLMKIVVQSLYGIKNRIYMFSE